MFPLGSLILVRHIRDKMSTSPPAHRAGADRAPNHIFTASAALGLAAVGLSCGYAVPSFAAMFSDLNVTLPLVTRVVVAVPRSAWVSASLLLSVLLCLKIFILSPAVSRVIDWLAVGLSIVSLAVVLPALFVPLQHVVSQVQDH